jgi:hypothetical protein
MEITTETCEGCEAIGKTEVIKNVTRKIDERGRLVEDKTFYRQFCGVCAKKFLYPPVVKVTDFNIRPVDPTEFCSLQYEYN